MFATLAFQNKRGNAQVDITEQDSITVNITKKNTLSITGTDYDQSDTLIKQQEYTPDSSTQHTPFLSKTASETKM